MWAAIRAMMLGALVLAGCNSRRGAADSEAPLTAPGSVIMNMKLTSQAFAEGQAIPKKFTGEGEDLSPPLNWAQVPDGTRELALIVDDPDAPQPQPWVHWLIYKIPSETRELPAGVPPDRTLPRLGGAMQGVNSFRKIGYGGPMPPPGHGVHHYHFKLYALNRPLDLQAGSDKTALLQAMHGRVIGEGELVGTYERR